MKNTVKSINIIGLGYVGLPLALLADKRGFKVVGIDVNDDRIAKINAKKSPFADDRLTNELLTSNILATKNFESIKEAEVIVICVPTPVYENYRPNLEPIIDACKSISPFLKSGQLVILESTVNPGVCEEVAIPILEKNSGLKAGKDFYLAHCPERINPGDPKWTVANIPRVVGSLEESGLRSALEFYRSIIDAEIKPMGSLKEAEAVKIIENCFRDINIAFVNELAMSFSRLGIDVTHVIEGAATKPFAFMPHFPGCGVGGHCISVDPYYLIDYAKQNGFNHRFLSLAREINNGMPRFTVDILIEHLNRKGIAPLGTRVAVLGLAYKANVNDDRESPAYSIIKDLKSRGLEVSSYDPYLINDSAASLKEALQGAQAVVIATAHDEFKSITPKFFKDNGIEIIIDGRNCLNKEEYLSSGLVYQGIGK
ncbi:MAG: nucleotide sugar dehydrogenase [Candidatus Paceibacterota bacterium]|jgi:nucleotide sugar dehydrogenase